MGPYYTNYFITCSFFILIFQIIRCVRKKKLGKIMALCSIVVLKDAICDVVCAL